jgi:predicted Zn finger-like uncharacterized protein
MIITCEQCGTRFNLDESLIQTEIVKVRCSRCQHVFTVARPEAQPQPSVETEPEGAPLADLDLPSEELVEPPPPSPEPEIPLSSQEEEEKEKVVVEKDLSPEPPPVQEDVAASAAAPGVSTPPRKWLPLILSVAGGCLLGLLLGALSLWYFGGKEASIPGKRATQAPGKETLHPPVPPPSPEDLRNLLIEFKDARYRGLVNVIGGQLLVIEGNVKNKTGEPRGPIRLKAFLTDSRNQPVEELLFYSGTSLTDEELLKSEPEEIKRWLATPGGREGARILKPGEKQPFTAVFFGVRPDLAEASYGFNVTVIAGPQVSTP